VLIPFILPEGHFWEMKDLQGPHINEGFKAILHCKPQRVVITHNVCGNTVELSCINLNIMIKSRKVLTYIEL
jgi:hypothetical protein